MADKVRIGFVGVGGMGQCAHLRNYVTIQDCEVVAIAEIRDEVRTKVAARYGIPKAYANHEEMLAKEKLDGIVASQPFTRHGVLVPELAKAKVPIFTEKPLAASIENGEAIITALKACGTWQMVGYHKRSDPASMYARAQIEQLKLSGEIGKLKYVRILMPAGDWVASGFLDLINSNEKPQGLKWDPPAAGMDEATRKAYESFVNYYIHQVNLMRYLLGEAYQVKYADPSGVMLAGQSASGVACVIEMTPYQTTIDWQESALIAFERGYVKLELPAPLTINRAGRVEVFKDPGSGATPQTVTPQMPWKHAMRQQAINFIRAIRGEIKPMCDADEALQDLKVAREYIRIWKGK
ncbi:MAG: dehydrogenase [Verrucomicrobia bacterium]|nr:dehydrogenase [Verrucomicrobiota bacterium]